MYCFLVLLYLWSICVLVLQGSKKLSPVDHMMHWIMGLEQKGSNAKKEIIVDRKPSTIIIIVERNLKDRTMFANDKKIHVYQ